MATDLQAAVGGTVVSLDDFVSKNRGGYVPHLKTDKLVAVSTKAHRPLIVEGVCVLAVLQRVQLEPDLLVYVKRVDEDGYWYDESICDPSELVDDLVARLAWEVAEVDRFARERSGEGSRAESTPKLTPLREEVIRYHATHRPSHKASIAFMRRGDA